MESRLHLEESAYYITSTLLIQRPLLVLRASMVGMMSIKWDKLPHSLGDIDINTLKSINAFTQNMNALMHLKMHKATYRRRKCIKTFICIRS